MDHGIETKEERAATDKPPTAQVILSAQNLGGDIIIACTDDGHGLDPEKLLAKGREKGILTKPENEYTEKEITESRMCLRSRNGYRCLRYLRTSLPLLLCQLQQRECQTKYGAA